MASLYLNPTLIKQFRFQIRAEYQICVASYFMYGMSHEGKYCTIKFLNQYNFICSKFYKLYKYNINISHNKTTGLRKLQ
jgi:hypothetical protein